MKSSVFLNVPLSSFPGGSGARVARGSVPASVFTFTFPGGPACAFPVPAVTDGCGPGQMTADRGHKRQNLSRFRQPEVQNRGVGRAVLRLGAPGRCQSSPPSVRGGLRLRWRVAASPRLLPPVPGQALPPCACDARTFQGSSYRRENRSAVHYGRRGNVPCFINI